MLRAVHAIKKLPVHIHSNGVGERSCDRMLGLKHNPLWSFHTFFSSYSMAILSLPKGSLAAPLSSPPSLSTASTSWVPLHRSINSHAKSIHCSTKLKYSFCRGNRSKNKWWSQMKLMITRGISTTWKNVGMDEKDGSVSKGFYLTRSHKSLNQANLGSAEWH